MAVRYLMLYSWGEFVAGDNVTDKLPQEILDRLTQEAKCVRVGQPVPAPAVDYSEWTVASLRSEAARRGLSYTSLKKAELIALVGQRGG